MGDVLLTGLLSHPLMRQVLGAEGAETTLDGHAAFRARPSAALRRYAEVMGLNAGQVLHMDAGEYAPELAAELARLILECPSDRPAADIRRRLPQMAAWAASRMRGRDSPPSGGDLVPVRGPDAVTVIARREVYAGYFSAEEWLLTHRRHDGGETPEIRREGFVSGDAVVVLPWDPVRDRVLLIDQFRLAPAMRHDPQPWLVETIAGRVDAGETVEDAVHREAREEADLTLKRLWPAIHNYPSPGAVTEYLYMYVAEVDLPDGVAGTHGLDSEAEDIRGHLLDRVELTRMVMAGQITNGPLALLALWLDREAARLKVEAGA